MVAQQARRDGQHLVDIERLEDGISGPGRAGTGHRCDIGAQHHDRRWVRQGAQMREQVPTRDVRQRQVKKDDVRPRLGAVGQGSFPLRHGLDPIAGAG